MSYWHEHVTIGNLSFPRFIGGPLDGITDSSFRQLVRQFSTQELLYTEMRHVACVANDKTGRLSLDFQQSERPLNYQFACGKLDFLDRAIDRVLVAGVDMIDLNVGCPAKNVVNSLCGSALMADLLRLEKILKRMRERISVPLTIKIRAGFTEKNAVDVALLAQDCGVDALAIHPRLRGQRFSGRPDYALAAQVKKALTIPVLLSGNVVNFKTARLAYEQTGVDGFLIGRGMWAKPWKLAELQAHASGQEYVIERRTVLRCALEHLDLMLAQYDRQGLFVFRKHLPFYLRGVPEASAMRQRLVVCSSIDEVKEGLRVSLSV